MKLYVQLNVQNLEVSFLCVINTKNIIMNYIYKLMRLIIFGSLVNFKVIFWNFQEIVWWLENVYNNHNYYLFGIHCIQVLYQIVSFDDNTIRRKVFDSVFGNKDTGADKINNISKVTWVVRAKARNFLYQLLSLYPSLYSSIYFSSCYCTLISSLFSPFFCCTNYSLAFCWD